MGEESRGLCKKVGLVPSFEDRRKIGAHYTSERDILKVIHPLFLDALRAEFDAIQQDRSGGRPTRLEDFRKRLTQLKFLDPACGCRNFLVIAYRELRTLELDVLKAQHSTQQLSPQSRSTASPRSM